MFKTPTINDIIEAEKIISPFIYKTPIRKYPALCDLLEAEVWVKHENFQILGSFKIRGGLYLANKVKKDKSIKYFVTASTGNHGQSVAMAASKLNLMSKIVVPSNCNPIKVESMLSLNAEVIHHGKDFDESLEFAESLCKENSSYFFVHPGNNKHLITGVATYTLEIHEELKGIDYIFIPIGAGSGAAGACIVSEIISPKTQIIGTQSQSSQAAYNAWKNGEFKSFANNTIAEGLATGHAYSYPINILREKLKDFILVSDEDIKSSTHKLIESTRTLVEFSSASTLAAALKIKKQIKNKKIVIVLSGSNINPNQLKSILN